jgi:hypothetical protein
MTEEMLRAVLDTAHTKTDKDGFNVLPDGKPLTLYAAHNGVPLTVAKVESIKVSGAFMRAVTVKGETFVLALDDVFAAAVDGGSEASHSRKAGFLG